MIEWVFPPKGQVAQLVEQRTENPRVGGSIPSLATISWHNSFYAADSVKILGERIDSIEFVHQQHHGVHRVAR